MGEVDYAGFVNGINSTANQGLASVLQSIQYRQQMARQKEQDALAAKLSNLQMEKERLQLAKLQGERDYQTGLQAAIESPNIVTAKQGEVTPQPSLADVLPSTPAYAPMPSSPQGQSTTMLADNNPSPEMLGKMMDTARRPSLQDLNPTQETRTDFGQPAPAYNGPLQPGVTLETQQQSPEKAAYAYALKHGKPEEAAKYATLADAVPKTSEIAMKHAKEIAALGDPKGAITYFNKMTGANLTYQGSKDDFIQIKDETSGRMAAYNWRTGETKEIAQVTPKQEYKFREYSKGGQTVAEESHDGGKTWSVVSTAPRYKPSGGSGSAPGASGAPSKPSKPLPVAALKLQDEELNAIGTAAGINADLGGVLQKITSGELQLGPVRNAVGTALNYAGMSTEGSRNLSTFKSTLEKLRNDSLRLNKGVQTEGDAQRAWNEIIANINDPELVKQRLDEVQKINDRAVTLRKNKIDVLRANYGLDPLDTTNFENVPSATGGATPQRQAKRPSRPAKKRPLPKF